MGVREHSTGSKTPPSRTSHDSAHLRNIDPKSRFLLKKEDVYQLRRAFFFFWSWLSRNMTLYFFFPSMDVDTDLLCVLNLISSSLIHHHLSSSSFFFLRCHRSTLGHSRPPCACIDWPMLGFFPVIVPSCMYVRI